MIDSVVWAQYINVTNTPTHRQTDKYTDSHTASTRRAAEIDDLFGKITPKIKKTCHIKKRVCIRTTTLAHRYKYACRFINNWRKIWQKPHGICGKDRDSHPNDMFLGSSKVSTPSRTSIRSVLFAQRSRITDRLTNAGINDRNRNSYSLQTS